jgi:putative monooxygenase
MQLVPVSCSSIPVKTDRGGQMQVLLSPKTVATKTGFMGTLVLAPGEAYKKHYHPYSDEYVYIINGEVTISEDTNAIVAQAGTAVFIPKNTPHRLENTGHYDTMVVFFSCPLAPQPDKGHVMLEE